MPQHWLVSWTPENFDTYRNMSYCVFGVPQNRRNVAKSIMPGDRLIIYILREQRLRAICECTSGYFYSDDVIWADGIYPHRIRTKLLTEGNVDYRAIRNQLEISQHGNLASGLELRGGYKKLSFSDYQLIESHFPPTKPIITPVIRDKDPVKIEQSTSHSEVVKLMETIGTRLGKKVELEWRGPEYRHDIVWKDKEYLPPSTVIEVCDKGALEKDILALEWACHNLKATAMLITINDNDFAQAKRRLPETSNIIVAKAETVIKLKELLELDYELIKAIFGTKK